MKTTPPPFRRIAIRTLPPRMRVEKNCSHQQVWNATHAFNQAVLNEIKQFATEQKLNAQADFDHVSVMDRLPVMFLPCTVDFFDALSRARLSGIKPWPKSYRAETFTPE